MLTEYSLKVCGTGEVLITKIEDGEPTHTYTVNGKLTNCTCPGAEHHKVKCKHLYIVQEWRRLGRPKGGLFQYKKYPPNHWHGKVKFTQTEETVG